MAETIGLDVILGMDSQQMQLELQKATNQLKQFEGQLKRSTNTAELAKLNVEIGNVKGTIGNLNTAMGNAAKKTGDATQSLINFSRIAQDAPYGIMGVANNLNPMLESFQQLAKTEGGTKKALTAMIDGLSGPAGLGVVLGVTSSLLVAFSKQISDAFEGGKDKLKELRDELKKLNEDVFKIAGAAQSSQTLGTILVGKITGKNNDIQTRKNALEQFKKLYKDSEEVQKLDIKDLNKYNQQYLQSVNNRAAIQQFEIGKQDNYTNALTAANAEYKKIQKERDNLIKNVQPTIKQQEQGKTKKMLENEIRASYVEPLKNAKIEIEAAKAALSKTVGNVLQFTTPGKKGKSGNGTKSTFAADVKEYKKQFDKIFTEGLSLYGTKKAEQTIDAFKSPTQKTPDQISPTGSFYKQVEEDNIIATNRIMLVKEQTQAYKDMADTVSNYATNALMGLWSSMEQGMNIGEALGAMFTDLAKQIAAAAIKALVFKAILAAFSGGSSEAATASAGAGSFFSIFKSLLGLPVTKNAAGGITNGPSWGLIGEGNEREAIMPLSKLGSLMSSTFNAGAMSGGAVGGGGQFVLRGNDLVLALQRSNYSLNLRRGA